MNGGQAIAGIREQDGSTAPLRTALNCPLLRAAEPYCTTVTSGSPVCAGQWGCGILFHTEEVTGSIPVSPTAHRSSSEALSGGLLAFLVIAAGDRKQREGSKGRQHPTVPLGCGVGVAVERCRCLLVTHDLGHVVDRHAVGDEPGGIRVPQVVKAQRFRESGAAQGRFPDPAVERAPADRLAGAGGKTRPSSLLPKQRMCSVSSCTTNGGSGTDRRPALDFGYGLMLT